MCCVLFCFRSWGPDDDGKTVDGPHLLAAVSPLLFLISCSPHDDNNDNNNNHDNNHNDNNDSNNNNNGDL